MAPLDKGALLWRRWSGAVFVSMTVLGLGSPPFALETGALIYTAFCAFASFLVTCALIGKWKLSQRLAFCAWVWARVLAAASFLYLIKLLDEQNGNISLAYPLLFVIGGAWLLSHDCKENGVAPRFPGVGVSSAGLILTATVAAYAGALGTA